MSQSAREIFQEQFHTQPSVLSQAPGRVEILGNHTDYNGGYVLTVAIDRSIQILGAKTDEPYVSLYSTAYRQNTHFPIQTIEHDPNCRWADYVKGVLAELRKMDISFGGINAVITGDLPSGEGLSSSAALESATAFFIQALYPYTMEKMQIAKLCRRAENQFVGMPCGLLDQFSSIFGKKNSMLFLDCDTLEHEEIPLPEPAPAIVLCPSGVKHELVESEYKIRRVQCEAAAQRMGQRLGRTIRFLRDVNAHELHDLEEILDTILRKRTRHVIYENHRVLHGLAAIKVPDLAKLGELMFESHESSRRNFENSCPELDILVEEASQIEGCYGAKLTGGGFGGSTVNLVEAEQAENFCRAIENRYRERTGRECRPLICGMGQGAHTVHI